MITVASYNIRKGLGTDRRRRPDRILDVLHEVHADIVALQEADRRFGARQSALPAELISQGEYKAVPFDIRPGGIGWHGNAILVRHSVEIGDYEPIRLPTLEPRGAVMAELRIGGNELRVVGMHLDLSGLWRRRQVRAIIDHIRRRRHKMPTVLMGDLNEWSLHGGCIRDRPRAPDRADRPQLPQPPPRRLPRPDHPDSRPPPRRLRRPRQRTRAARVGPPADLGAGELGELK
ncbi:endonuclease/exonuclease/phosphatase family protein [Rhizorhabdus histidinilytica]